MLEVKMSVDLRGRDARMAEHFLHRAQVSGRLEQVRGERVTQHVRVDVLRQAETPRPVRKSVAHRTGRHAPAARADEKGRFPRPCEPRALAEPRDRKSTRLNSSHLV